MSNVFSAPGGNSLVVRRETASQTAGPYVHIGLAPKAAGFDVFENDFGNVLATPATQGERIRIEGQRLRRHRARRCATCCWRSGRPTPRAATPTRPTARPARRSTRPFAAGAAPAATSRPACGGSRPSSRARSSGRDGRI